MAKRRKVGNLLALAVLSVLIERPMHPYEMASVLRERGKEQDFEIKWGSLYTVVQNLEKHGFVAAAESTRQGGRPERTVYRLTDAGRAELDDWIRELLAVPEREHPRFVAGLSIMAVLPPEDVISLLSQRLSRLQDEVAGERTALTQAVRTIPRLFLVEAEFSLAIRQAEVTWLRSLLDEFTDGSFPELAQWRAWHETGQIPDDLTTFPESEGSKD